MKSLLFFLLCGAALSLFSRAMVAPRLKVTACPVGQGDAVLVQYGELVILIDTGPNSSILRCLQAELSPLRSEIDVLVLTHADQDHIGGFSDVVKSYKVKRLLVNPKEKTTAAGRSVTEWIEQHGLAHVPLGGEIYFSPGLRLKVLWSEHLQSTKNGTGSIEGEWNSDSIGISIEAESFGFLSLGDLECAQELAVSGSPLLNTVHLLKMSHHGAKTSSCLEFLQRIHPEAVFYSAGAGNKYGHPAPESLKSVEKVGAGVFGTDTYGMLTFQRKNGKIVVQGVSEMGQ